MRDSSGVQKIDLDKVDWRGSREFFESLGEALDKLDDKDESYDFTWVGKRKAIIEAGAPINKTLRPDIEASKDWDTTGNLFIEGDNLDALKLLQESYLGKVKMIYIDPPYNTGKDFVYRDNFKANIKDYEEDTEYKDEEGNINYKKNEKTNGRYHSDWLSMMYPRLKLARNLLKDDGVIFISIDDNEQTNLKKLCDEVFGEDNFVASIIWEKKYAPQNDAKYFSTSHDYILMYAKSIDNFDRNLLPRDDDQLSRYKNPDNDPRGPWQSDNFTVATYSAKYDYPITLPSGRVINPTPGRCWRTSKEKLNEMIEDNRISFGPGGDNVPRIKRFLSEVQDGRVPTTLWRYSEVGHNQSAATEVKNLMGGKKYFDYPKPVSLIMHMAKIATTKDSIVIDFFSGSGTTAHSVMKLNAEDGGSRKHIQVQLPEKTEEGSEAFKAGYATIPQISLERIRRAGEKIKADFKDEIAIRDTPLDVGFRALKITDTSYKEVHTPASGQTQELIRDNIDNIKDDRTEIDLLFGVLTQSALELNRPVVKRIISDSDVYLYDYFDKSSGLIACFAKDISEDTIKEIANLKPLTAVFRDSSFKDSQAKVNLSEHFRIISPDTKVKVI